MHYHSPGERAGEQEECQSGFDVKQCGINHSCMTQRQVHCPEGVGMYFKAMEYHDNSQSGVDEGAVILEYCTVYFGKQLPTFLRSVTASIIWFQPYKSVLIAEAEGSTMFRNVGQIAILIV